MISPPLDPRLAAAASFARAGAVIADIGTDHAYLPISLLLAGRAPFAVASDVNEGPLLRAKANAEKYGVAGKMRFVRADGLCGLEPERDHVGDICICGMGGELIARIVDNSDYVKTPGVRLVLQPMSSVYELRSYLAEAGFMIEQEKMCRSGGKIYTCMVCEYDGIKRELTEAELELGQNVSEEESDENLNLFLRRTAEKLTKQIEGRKKGGLDTSREEGILEEVRAIGRARGFFDLG
jgi:tRNA (adenine22-N1)-methyltransferase